MEKIQEQFFDIGANLTHPSFEEDIESVITDAQDLNVKRMSITGSDLEESIKAFELAEQYPDCLVSTAGIHPHNAKEYSSNSFTEITALLKLEEVKCLGETGLDFYRNYSSPKQQEVSFEAHIEAAIDYKVPLFLHEREAHDKFVEVLTPYMKELPVSVVHCFTGSKSALEKYIEMGFFIGITGWLCDERRGKHLEDLIPLIPLEKLMIETDAPYLLPRDMGIDKSSRNEPKYLPHVAKRVAELRNESVELVYSAIYMNSLNFFNIS